MRTANTLDWTGFCRYIAESGERIPALVGEMDYGEFVASEVTHLAVWQIVEVLSEASRKIDADFDRRHPALQLELAYTMRNKLTHDHSTVDLGVLWSTIHDFVPQMVQAAKTILASKTL